MLVRGALGTTETPFIDYSNKLLAKNEALEGFSTHMKFLAQKKISLSHFARNAEEMRNRSGSEIVVLLSASI